MSSFRLIWVLVVLVVVCVTAQEDDMFSMSEWNKFERRQKRRKSSSFLFFPKIDQYFGTTHMLRHDGLRRWFMEYKPKRLKDNAPLIIQLHWGGGNMRSSNYLGRIIEKDLWLKLSKKHGFLVLSPNGTAKRKRGGLNTYGMSQEWYDILGEGPANTGADDVGFIKALVDWAVTKRNIDPNRVYVTGISAGGLMTYKLLVEAPGLVAAAAVFGSNLPLRAISNLTLPTPILMMSGTNDRRMPWDGRTDGGGVGRGQLRSAEATRDYFVSSNAAGPMVNETALPDIDPNDGCRIYLQYYDSTTAPVAFYRMEGGGHVPPGVTYERFEEFFLDNALGTTCHDIIGIDVAWEFMSKFTL